jgi:hypothetical protein
MNVLMTGPGDTVCIILIFLFPIKLMVCNMHWNSNIRMIIVFFWKVLRHSEYQSIRNQQEQEIKLHKNDQMELGTDFRDKGIKFFYRQDGVPIIMQSNSGRGASAIVVKKWSSAK